jgi:SAM-dependent methyltransferase
MTTAAGPQSADARDDGATAAERPHSPGTVWAAALVAAALPGALHCHVRSEDGRRRRLRVERFLGAASPADEAVLARATGPVLDVGCGPGRMLAALGRRGVPALGVDISPAAVELARASGGRALCRSVFAPLPGEGAWSTVLLLDGNVGIGGAPARVLRRAAELLAPGGRVLVETGPPGLREGCARVRLELGALVSDWFAWGVLGAGAVAPAAAAAGFAVQERLATGGRWFACLG